MAAGDDYRAEAFEINERAKAKKTPQVLLELDAMALRYLHLIEQADRNARSEIVYEDPRPQFLELVSSDREEQRQSGAGCLICLQSGT